MTVRSRPLHVDPSAVERDTPGLFDELLADRATRVIAVNGDAVAVLEAAEPAVALFEPAAVGGAVDWAFLGRSATGGAVLAAVVERDETAPADTAWGSLREIGALLAPEELDVVVTAVSLGRWITDARFCPVCGGAAPLAQAGWSRRCSVCGREHFPRTDPAVIVAVASADGERLLLGANAAWRGRMFSCFAGFVEAGESLEEAVHREIGEEAGVRLTDLRYEGSQAWPYPRSIMLGFQAVCVADDEARADGDEILQVRWFTRDEVAAGLAGRGEVGFPGPVSIAHRLIRSWYEAA